LKHLLRYLFGKSWSNVEAITAMLLVQSKLGFWSAIGIFLAVIVVNDFIQMVSEVEH
jgi:hypothetical protein